VDRQTLLKSLYFFRDAGKEDLASLAEIVSVRNYAQGELVFNEGDEANAMFVVEMGTVDIVPAGKERAVVTIGSGQSFGEIAFFSRGKRPASARAKEMSRIVSIPFDHLEPLLEQRPALAISLYRNACAFLAKHLRTLLSELNHRYF
jgi:CRP-like cAMP-binding protein